MNTTPLDNKIDRGLRTRVKSGLFRRLPPAGSSRVNLSTNSYLDLESEDAVRERALQLQGNDLGGNTASRLISERSGLYKELEHTLARWKRTESALVFNSGYAANAGALQAICTRDTEVFSDRLNHASIIDGIRLSGARLIRYRHGDIDDLRRRLELATRPERLIVTDSVFSMDGDYAPLESICELAEQFGCMVMVDEAHAAGIFGKNKSGIVEMMGLEDAVAIRIGTLSKSLAGLGGFFAGDARVRDYLINHARSLVYSTALPHSVLSWNVAALNCVRENTQWGDIVLRKAQAFREGLQSIGFDTGNSASQIVPCIVGEPERAQSLSHFLFRNGIAAPAIRPPTVPSGTARVRFSLHRKIEQATLEEVLWRVKQWKEHRA